MDNRKTVVGVFHTEEEALRAISNLQNLGYSKDQISVLAENSERFTQLDNDVDIETKSPNEVKEGAATGAVAGGILGGLGTLVAELGLIAIPGVGPFLAAGPIVATITGLVAGGAVGGALGALVGLGIKEEDAEIYEQNLKDGDILVLVEADEDRYDEVHSSMNSIDAYSGKQGLQENEAMRRETLANDGVTNSPETPIDPNYSYYATTGNANGANENPAKNPQENTSYNEGFEDTRSLKDRMDRDNDGGLDVDDLRPNAQDTNTYNEGFEDNRSLKDKMDRDNDGKLDFDDLRIHPRDTDNEKDKF